MACESGFTRVMESPGPSFISHHKMSFLINLLERHNRRGRKSIHGNNPLWPKEANDIVTTSRLVFPVHFQAYRHNRKK